MHLTYPQFFQEKLASSPRLRGQVDLAISVVSEVLTVSHLPFFPDYTDHGFDHLSAVLAIADKLMTNDARGELTAEDIAVLVISILLHDLALHLSEAGFETLLLSSGVIKTDWALKFGEFFTEAQHWNQRELVDVFGVDAVQHRQGVIRNPLDHLADLNETDRKLIGEFIRRHHPFLALEFARCGFPGASGERIIFSSVGRDLLEIAGQVARSHGLPLRGAIQLLDECQIHRLEEQNVHPIYLMGLIRIADYLDMGANRAPMIAFSYKTIASLISRKEWANNQALRTISWGIPDIESLYIPAKPTNVESYLVLTRWLNDIQYELDTTWAVFGEFYGIHPRLSLLRIAIRRVRSNILDDPKAFAKAAPFVPRQVALEIAGSEVAKLFVEPLYGARPEIAIRELLQNSVDAVNERWAYEKRHQSNGTSPSETGSDPDVQIWLDGPSTPVPKLTVVDRGIGMSEDVVIDYFLKVGASFRNSIAWKREFNLPTQDANGDVNSKVMRSGRFGVGVLAAFLLGDSIEVWTRHVASDRGLTFRLTMDVESGVSTADSIEIKYDETIPVGTSISVSITKVVPDSATLTGTNIYSNDNLWDWYCLKMPSVGRYRGPERLSLEQVVTVPSETDPLPPGWHSVATSDYRTVHVLVGGRSSSPVPPLICNGIVVGSRRSGSLDTFPNSGAEFWHRGLFQSGDLFQLVSPSFSVFDPDGRLPLNLQRTGLTNKNLDFISGAFDVQSKSAFAAMLKLAPEEAHVSKDFGTVLGDYFEFDNLLPIFFTRSGVATLTLVNLQVIKARSVLVIERGVLNNKWLGDALLKYDAIFVAQRGSRQSSAKYALNKVAKWVDRVRIVSTSKEEIVLVNPIRLRYNEKSYGHIHVHRGRDCPDTLLTEETLHSLDQKVGAKVTSKKGGSSDDFLAAEIFLKDTADLLAEDEFSIGRQWCTIFDNGVIPFNIGKRNRLTKARRRLETFL